MSVEKFRRNSNIYKLSKMGGGTFSYRELQAKYGFKSVKTIYEIVAREHRRLVE